ncbi:MAG: hypothetical protein HC845_11080 [Akkermansiaceae bacterium]|nr:hypothetical protein [Akkermansiaceae bacterium]
MKITSITAFAALLLIGLGGFMVGRISSKTSPAVSSSEGAALTGQFRSEVRGSEGENSLAKRESRPNQKTGIKRKLRQIAWRVWEKSSGERMRSAAHAPCWI